MWPQTTTLPCTQRGDGNLPIETQFLYVNPQNENGADLPRPAKITKIKFSNFVNPTSQTPGIGLGRFFLCFVGYMEQITAFLFSRCLNLKMGFHHLGRSAPFHHLGRSAPFHHFIISHILWVNYQFIVHLSTSSGSKLGCMPAVVPRNSCVVFCERLATYLVVYETRLSQIMGNLWKLTPIKPTF